MSGIPTCSPSCSAAQENNSYGWGEHPVLAGRLTDRSESMYCVDMFTVIPEIRYLRLVGPLYPVHLYHGCQYPVEIMNVFPGIGQDILIEVIPGFVYHLQISVRELICSHLVVAHWSSFCAPDIHWDEASLCHPPQYPPPSWPVCLPFFFLVVAAAAPYMSSSSSLSPNSHSLWATLAMRSSSGLPQS